MLEFTPPPCEYWNFQICNIWQENLDTFEDGNGWVNNYRFNAEPDGTVRIRIRDLEGSPEQAVDQVIEQLEHDVRERPWAWWNWGLLDALTTPPGG